MVEDMHRTLGIMEAGIMEVGIMEDMRIQLLAAPGFQQHPWLLDRQAIA
jgi:hypothetical protein